MLQYSETERLSRTYLAGEKAFAAGTPRQDNPYDVRGGRWSGPAACYRWWHGWDAAAYEHGVKKQPRRNPIQDRAMVDPIAEIALRRRERNA